MIPRGRIAPAAPLLQTVHGPGSWVCGFLLCACLVLPAAAQTLDEAMPESAPAFALQVQAPEAVRELLLRHLELLRYQSLSDLDATELQRLLTAADRQVRELLATTGHFAPGWNGKPRPPPTRAHRRWPSRVRPSPSPARLTR